MSVRPVLEESSRFSLKRALLGEHTTIQTTEIQPPPLQLPTAYHTPVKTTAQPATALSFKFNLKPHNAPAIPHQPTPVKNASFTFASFTETGRPASQAPPPTSIQTTASLSRSKDDVMRLSSIVDSSNAKIAALSERLSNTEASLQKANAAFTTERSRARELKARLTQQTNAATTEISKLKELCNNKMTQPTNSADAAFKTLAKVKEQLELKHEEIDKLKSEAVETRASIALERKAMQEAISTATAVDTAAVDTAAVDTATALATAAATAMTETIATLSNERDQALECVESVKSANTKLETDTESAIVQMHAWQNLHALDKTHFQTKLSQAETECQLLKQKVETHAQQMSRLDDVNCFPISAWSHYDNPRIHDEGHHNDTQEIFVEKRSTDSKFKNKPHPVLSSTSLCCSGATATLHGESPFATGIAQTQLDPRVEKLIAAVSADLIKSALGSRGEYLLASGMSPSDIANELKELEGADDEPSA